MRPTACGSGKRRAGQLDLLRLTLAFCAADGSRTVTLVRSWQDGEAARAHAAALAGDGAAVKAWFDQLHEVLIFARDRGWMRRLLEWSGVTRHVVVAVGAMQLPGEDGLLCLLEECGFAIRRLNLAH